MCSCLYLQNETKLSIVLLYLKVNVGLQYSSLQNHVQHISVEDFLFIAEGNYK